MRSPLQAVFWEICARNRWALVFAFGLIPFCAFLRWIVPAGHELVNVVHGFSAVATFVSLVWVCSYSANDSRGGFSGFPSWMYTLPLRTSALVAGPMLLGFVLMSGAVLAWEFTFSICWDLPFKFTYVGWHLLLAVGVLVSIQALIWSLHRFRWIRVVALVAAMFGFLYVGLVGQGWKFPEGEFVWFAGVALVVPLAVVGGIAGVERDRRGRWQGWTGKLLEWLVDHIPRRAALFSSAAGAQLWFEWRRRGFFVATAFGVIMALCVFTYPLSAALYLGPVETLFNFSGPFLGMIFIAGVIGNSLAKSDMWSADLGVHPLVAVRPLRTDAQVFAKWKAAALVTLLGWALFVILLWPVVAMSSRMSWPDEQALRFWNDFPTTYPRFWRWLTNPVVIFALLAATWHTMVQTMAVVLEGNKRRMILAAWQGALVIAAVCGCGLWLYKDRSKVDIFFRFLSFFTAAMMALKAWGTVSAFRAVRPHVSRRNFFVLAGLWLGVAILVVAAGVFAQLENGLPTTLLWLLVLWQFFPSGEIPSCIVALARNRHR